VAWATARGTENAPSAMHWSPWAWPITAAGTSRGGPAQHGGHLFQATATTTRGADSPNAASAAVHDRSPAR
jgi:hypothetical protein